MMTDKRIEDIVEKMLEQAGTPDPNILAPDGMPVGEPSEIQVLTVVVQNLEMGFMQLAQAQESLGIVIDTARLTLQMIVNLMIEKELVSKEEMQTRYKTDVAEKVMERQKQRQEEIQKQITKAQAEAGKAQEDIQEIRNSKPEASSNSDVVLPSERAGGPITFPRKD
jgi:gas vesicle protein